MVVGLYYFEWAGKIHPELEGRTPAYQSGMPSPSLTHRRMTSHIKLYGPKGERFEEIKTDMTDRFGYEPTNPEIVGILMAKYESDGTVRSAPRQ